MRVECEGRASVVVDTLVDCASSHGKDRNGQRGRPLSISVGGKGLRLAVEFDEGSIL